MLMRDKEYPADGTYGGSVWCSVCGKLLGSIPLIDPDEDYRCDKCKDVVVRSEHTQKMPPVMTERDRLAWTVMQFAERMIAKLQAKYDEGYQGWSDSAMRSVIEQKLREHTEKLIAGDTSQAVDVANLAMFIECMEDQQRAQAESLE